ncbi:hypothetical protein B0T22DRAFT_426769 [Podospora appendiculata]|uniref:FAD-binding PCMH-type domain-containing protein n=1 Tax=Podospora appendiculata TaxID=314037 RepID=A0AAE1CCX2_9PEZI|nr:hypothetical protein B0T22DRAFT_426769 [Podospora appendiculata]
MAASSSVVRVCCLALAASVGNQKVAFPGSAAYNASLASYFSAQQASVQPACIVQAQTANDVSAAVVTLTTTAAGLCPFAVRSGGHTGFVGASNSPGGVTIDLRALKSVTVSNNGSRASVGVGNTWDTVYAKLDPLGLSVAGGRAAGVGVGGLTLGGGISYFSPRYGFTCDTVSNFQVVLASGAIVNANATSNPDLFVALRGGSNNFGIVTRVDLKAFDQGLMFAGTSLTSLAIADDQIAEFVKFSAADTYDEYSSLITSFAYSQAQGIAVVSNTMQYTKPVENPAVFQTFLSFPAFFKTTGLANMTSISQATQALNPDGMRQLSVVTTIVSTEAALKAAYVQWNNSLANVTGTPGLVWSLVLEPLPPAIYAKGAKTNSLGLANRNPKSLVVALINTAWLSAADDAKISGTAYRLLAAIESETRRLGAYDPYVYLNYAGQFQDPIASYGVESVLRLKLARARYDPWGVFTRQVAGGYKIPGLF